MGGDSHILRAHARPNRVKRLQPTKEQSVLPCRHRTGQALVHVVMCVHEPGRDKAPRGLHNLRIAGRQTVPKLNHLPIPKAEVGILQFASAIIHGQDRSGVADQDMTHQRGLSFNRRGAAVTLAQPTGPARRRAKRAWQRR